ncbi:MAG: hypothetical protein QOE36_1236 [Gaiellaceae bacterium]|nr:hypothetical protein [Gaiellaceae bacterium]
MSRPDESGEELVDESGRNPTQRSLDEDPDTSREVDTEWDEPSAPDTDEGLPPAS